MSPFPPRLLAALLLMTTPLPAVLAADTPPSPPFLNPDAAKPPATARHPKIVGLHGDKIEDPYFWLREKSNPAVIEHLKAENTYTAAVMAPFKPYEDGLYKEMLGRIKQADTSAPYRQRGYWLYQRTEEGKQYPILCRKKGELTAPEEVVLDVNALAAGQKFMALARSSTTTTTPSWPIPRTPTATGTTISTSRTSPRARISALPWARSRKSPGRRAGRCSSSPRTKPNARTRCGATPWATAPRRRSTRTRTNSSTWGWSARWTANSS